MDYLVGGHARLPQVEVVDSDPGERRLEPYSRATPRALWWSQGGGLFLISEVFLKGYLVGGHARLPQVEVLDSDAGERRFDRALLNQLPRLDSHFQGLLK